MIIQLVLWQEAETRHIIVKNSQNILKAVKYLDLTNKPMIYDSQTVKRFITTLSIKMTAI